MSNNSSSLTEPVGIYIHSPEPTPTVWDWQIVFVKLFFYTEQQATLAFKAVEHHNARLKASNAVIKDWEVTDHQGTLVENPSATEAWSASGSPWLITIRNPFIAPWGNLSHPICPACLPANCESELTMSPHIIKGPDGCSHGGDLSSDAKALGLSSTHQPIPTPLLCKRINYTLAPECHRLQTCIPSPRLAPTMLAYRAGYPTLNPCTPPSASQIHDRSRTCLETGIKDLRTIKQPQKESHPVGLTSAQHYCTQLTHTHTTSKRRLLLTRMTNPEWTRKGLDTRHTRVVSLFNKTRNHNPSSRTHTATPPTYGRPSPSEPMRFHSTNCTLPLLALVHHLLEEAPQTNNRAFLNIALHTMQVVS